MRRIPFVWCISFIHVRFFGYRLALLWTGSHHEPFLYCKEEEEEEEEDTGGK